MKIAKQPTRAIKLDDDAPTGAEIKAAKRAEATKKLIAKRAAKTAADLARWERRLKIAKSKVTKLRKRAKYYAGKGN